MYPVRRSTFLIGFVIAALTALIVWYYQKSTSAEEGALDPQMMQAMLGQQMGANTLPPGTSPLGPQHRGPLPAPLAGGPFGI